MERIKRRSPLVAVLLSIVLPGLGQVYCGKLARGIIIYLGLWLLIAVVGLSGLITGFGGLIAAVAIIAVYQIVIAAEAGAAAVRLKEMPLKKYNRWYVYVAAILLLQIMVAPALDHVARFQLAELRTYRMPASSMRPALVVGDCFMAKLDPYRKSVPKRGEVVVFDYPSDKTKSFIMRVIGLPGELVEIKDKQVFINGQLLEDPWGTHGDSRTLPKVASTRDNMDPVTVPAGSVFVLGDNRDFSHDSRFWGCVEIKDIHARPLFIYWSDDRRRLGKNI
jgi:signal peptidase I